MAQEYVENGSQWIPMSITPRSLPLLELVENPNDPGSYLCTWRHRIDNSVANRIGKATSLMVKKMGQYDDYPHVTYNFSPNSDQLIVRYHYSEYDIEGKKKSFGSRDLILYCTAVLKETLKEDIRNNSFSSLLRKIFGGA